jgi:hypothetical protein
VTQIVHSRAQATTITKTFKRLSDNNAALEPIKLNDYHALGVIDSFAKVLNRIISKEFLDNKNTKWINVLPDINES